MRNLIPTMFSREYLLNQTVTIPVVDLYDFLTRRKDDPMPDLNQATTVKRVKRGYRKVSMMLTVGEFEMLSKMAELETRSPDQQAAHMMRRMLVELQSEAIKTAYRDAEQRRELADGTVQEERDAWEEDVEQVGIQER